MDTFLNVVVAIGLFCIVSIQIVAMVMSFTKGFGEVLRVFLIPGYALWIACTDETWAKWMLGVGLGFIFIGLILM